MENSPPSFHRHRISLRPISTLKSRRNFFKWITRSKKSSKLNNLIRKSIHPLILRTTKYPVSSFQFPSRHVSVDQDSLISREISDRSEGSFSIRNGTNWLLDTLEERIIFSREDYRANFLAETRGIRKGGVVSLFREATCAKTLPINSTEHGGKKQLGEGGSRGEARSRWKSVHNTPAGGMLFWKWRARAGVRGVKFEILRIRGNMGIVVSSWRG